MIHSDTIWHFSNFDPEILWYVCLLDSTSDVMTDFMYIPKWANGSNELQDLHTTQTPVSEVHASVVHEWLPASEVHASVVTEWPPACLHKLLPRWNQMGNCRKPRMKDVPTWLFFVGQIFSKTYSSFKPTCNFLKIFLSFKWYFRHK